MKCELSFWEVEIASYDLLQLWNPIKWPFNHIFHWPLETTKDNQGKIDLTWTHLTAMAAPAQRCRSPMGAPTIQGSSSYFFYFVMYLDVMFIVGLVYVVFCICTLCIPALIFLYFFAQLYFGIFWRLVVLSPSSRIQLFPRHEINSVATASASQFVILLLFNIALVQRQTSASQPFKKLFTKL